MKRTLGAVLLLAACACAAAQQGKPHRLTNAEKMGISGARSLRDKVTDPESFRVSSVRIVVANKDTTGHSADGVYWVCVEGRAKNKMGGYVSLLGLAMSVGPSFEAVALDVSEAEAPTSGYQLRCTYPWTGSDGASTVIVASGVDVTDAAKAALKGDREKE
jgi:hypothetical protein